MVIQFLGCLSENQKSQNLMNQSKKMQNRINIQTVNTHRQTDRQTDIS